MKKTHHIWITLLLAAAVAAWPGSAGAGEERDDTGDEAEAAETEARDDGDRKEEIRVFTNEDLKRYRRRAHAGAGGTKTIVADMSPKEAPAPQPDAVDPAQKKRLISELEAKIQAARQRLDAIAAREASLRNPFLPRPPISEEERAATAGMDAKEQLAVLQAEKQAIQESLPGLREELARVSRLPVKAREPASESDPAATPPPPPAP